MPRSWSAGENGGDLYLSLYLQAGRKSAVINVKLGQASERFQCPVVPHCYPEPNSALQHSVRLYPSCIFRRPTAAQQETTMQTIVLYNGASAPQHEAMMERSGGLKSTVGRPSWAPP